MRVATLIIGLMLVVGLFIQSLLVGGLSNAAGDDDSSAAAAVGVLMALIWIFGCALVIPLPRVAMILFGIAAAMGFAAAANFPDLGVWGGISMVLALFSFFGWRGKRKAERKEAERDELIAQAAGAQLATARSTAFLAQGVSSANQPHASQGIASGEPARTCPACGAPNAAGTRFCGACGSRIAGMAGS